MSSHHIIREDQEPALIIDDLTALPLAYINQLLEWNPSILANDSTLTSLQELGIKVDIWFTKDNSIDLSQDSVSIKRLGAGFLESALNHLLEQGQRAVNIVSTDQAVPQIMLHYAGRINPVLFGNGRRIAVVKSGFSKWKPAGEEVWLYDTEPPTNTAGLIQRNENEYVTQADGFFSVVFAGPFGLVGERL